MGYIEDNDRAQVLPMAGGESGIMQTISFMKTFALGASADPLVREAAEEVIRNVQQRAYGMEARMVESWIRKRLRYTRDGLNVETIKAPRRMLEELKKNGVMIGDCDDASTLAAALLLSLGHRPAFQVLGRGEVPHHVNVLDVTSGVVVDPTGEPRGSFGYRKVYLVK